MKEGESRPQPEREPNQPYTRSARFAEDAAALKAYTAAQGLLFSEECDLSAYRIRYKQVPHVIVLGQKPPDTIDRKLVGILESGEPASLPPEVITVLDQRRRQARRIGPWLEGHYRPGRPI